MKKIPVLFVFVSALLLFNCGGKQNHQNEVAQTNDSVWVGMDEFHMIMAESFHPFKDSSNLEPAKRFAHKMDSLAGVWVASTLPEKVKTAEVKAKLDKLKTDTEAFAETVKVEADSTIAKSLTDLHDQFHDLQEAWYGGHEKHDGHH